MGEEKEEIRRKMLWLLKSVKEKGIFNLKSNQIKSILSDFITERKLNRVGVYSPVEWEVDLWELWKEWEKEGKEVFFPRLNGKVLQYIKVKRMEDELLPGAYGIKEPIACSPPSPLETIDAFVFPGIAFSMNGIRLGRGGGYVDRTFAGKSCSMIGVCYHFQLLEFLPRDPWDVKMDFIITERGIFKIKKEV